MNLPHGASSIGETRPGQIHIGISSWNSLPGFYPASLRGTEKLAWYSRVFGTVEINTSFYGNVQPDTFHSWLDLTPDDFHFAVKAVRTLTHEPGNPPDREFTAFRDSLQPLLAARRLAAVLFQFPPSFSRTVGTEAALARVAREMRDIPTAIEFRHQSWLSQDNAEATLELLRSLGLAYAIADEPQLPHITVPPLPAVTSRLAYLRLHGRNQAGWLEGKGKRYDYSYTAAELADWRNVIRALAQEAQQLLVYFNNNERGDGTLNALTLAEMLGVARPNAPEQPLGQATLFNLES